jgi:O-antigen/teichoic acid export membrane protein
LARTGRRGPRAAAVFRAGTVWHIGGGKCCQTAGLRCRSGARIGAGGEEPPSGAPRFEGFCRQRRRGKNGFPLSRCTMRVPCIGKLSSLLGVFGLESHPIYHAIPKLSALFTMAPNTQRIAKNTLMLYFRQALIMLVGLYTVRVVLNTLGAEDYGIYSAVAGVVTVFGFLNGIMAAALQRYFSFEIGRGDFERLEKIFRLSITIYVLIIVLVLFMGETIGLWYMGRKLIVPMDRKKIAMWIYQFSMVSLMFSIITTPYMAAIIAHEDMDIYAYVSIVEAGLKLVVVFFLRFFLLDKLLLYGILMCAVVLINTGIYRTICTHKYRECKFKFYWEKKLFKEIAGYTGWHLFGALGGVSKYQGITILLNQFFSPFVVAASAIAATVNAAVSSFSNNFIVAVQPQIIKSYAAGKKDEAVQIVFLGAKGAYFLMYLFVLPLMLEMPLVLALWLKNPPEYAVLFTRLVLLDVLINSMGVLTGTLAQATGRIKLYNSVLGGIQIFNFPISLLILRLGAPAYSVVLVAICITFSVFILRFPFLKRLVAYSIKEFFRKVALPACVVSVISAVLPIMLHNIMESSFLRLFVVIGASGLSACGCIYFLGLDNAERKALQREVGKRIHIARLYV